MRKDKNKTTENIENNVKIIRIPLDTIITVTNNSKSPMLYISKDEKTSVEWDDFGSDSYMTMQELVTMKNSQRRFFEENWITLSDDNDEYTSDDIYRFLRVDKMYSKILNQYQIEDLLDSDIDEIRSTIVGLSKGMKETIKDIVSEKIINGVIDSKQKISTLEEVLHCSFND